MFDGGKDSTVTGYWLIENKNLFSIAILVFEDGSRENYHSHAFDAWSWILKGKLKEEHLGKRANWIKPSWRIFKTGKWVFHKVTSYGRTYAITFRGPWDSEWEEYSPKTDERIGLTHGRIETFRVPYGLKK